jgi:hypothetical protein
MLNLYRANVFRHCQDQRLQPPFHTVCILAWFRGDGVANRRCPNCRMFLFEAEPHPPPVLTGIPAAIREAEPRRRPYLIGNQAAILEAAIREAEARRHPYLTGNQAAILEATRARDGAANRALHTATLPQNRGFSHAPPERGQINRFQDAILARHHTPHRRVDGPTGSGGIDFRGSVTVRPPRYYTNSPQAFHDPIVAAESDARRRAFQRPSPPPTRRLGGSEWPGRPGDSYTTPRQHPQRTVAPHESEMEIARQQRRVALERITFSAAERSSLEDLLAPREG